MKIGNLSATFTRETIFVTSCLLSSNQLKFYKGVYFLKGKKLLPDSFL